MMRRTIRTVLRLALLAVLVLAGFVAWAEFWPGPHLPVRARCPEFPGDCVVASGRVLYHTRFGPGRRAHVVLLSRRSVTFPGLVTAEFPQVITATPAGLGFGDWVTIYGLGTIGSHHEHDIHLNGFRTARETVQCGVFGAETDVCHVVASRPAGR